MADMWWIADALAAAGPRGTPLVLASVVRTEGSTYRRAGARMLFGADGAAVGAVSGGCLEADLALRAEAVLAAGAPAVVTYDTQAAEDLVWGLGLGCNGRVDVLLEPLAADALAGAATGYARCAALADPAVLATVIAVTPGSVRGGGHAENPSAPPIGARALVTADAVEAWDAEAWALAPAGLTPALVEDARTALRSGRSVVRRYAAAAGHANARGAPDPRGAPDAPAFEVLHEVLQPPIALLVCGAGHDAVPVVRFAAALGWRVTVADDRPGHARAERFPEAEVRLLAPGEPATARWPGARTPARAAAVVMAHHVDRDRAHLAAVLATEVRYVGALGPRRRTAQLLADLGAEHQAPRLHAPVGLDLGAESPEEIALAIVAEVAGVMGGRAATSLRERRAGIHDRDPGRDHTSAPLAPLAAVR